MDGRPKLLDQVRNKVRLKHYSIRTEQAYVGRIKRFVHFHDLRHTHATMMLKRGVPPRIVSERLGHATISITLDTYSHVTPGLQEAAALRFDEGLVTTRTEQASLSKIPVAD